MNANLEKLKSLAKPAPEEDLAKAAFRKENREWLRKSKEIALSIHYYLRTNNMTQKELSEKLHVSPTYVGMLLKGKENLTLETISKVESIIGERLVMIRKPYRQDVFLFYPADTSTKEWSEAISATMVDGMQADYFEGTKISA